METAKEVLENALSTLNSTAIDFYNYNKEMPQVYNFEVVGKAVLVKRMLAELVNADLNEYLLPGESSIEDDDDSKDWIRFVSPIDGELTSTQINFLLKTVLPTCKGLQGIQDSDDACIRCLTRMIAEVAGYPNLGHYALLGRGGNDRNSPIYYKGYIPHEDKNKPKT